MSEKIEAVLPPQKPQGKRGRGRPKIQGATTVPLFNLPGEEKADRLEVYYEERGWTDCTRCALGQGLAACGEHRPVLGDGSANADVMIIGEAPGEEEQASGLPFIGAAGQTLNQMLAMVSDDPEIQKLVEWYSRVPHTAENQITFHDAVFNWRHREFFITNVVACQPPENRAPSNPEVKECWERVWNTIYIVDPLLIIACGNSALAAVTRKPTAAQIMKMRGQIFDVEFDGKIGKITYPVIPILHPSFLNRVADWKLKDGNFAKTVQDLRNAMRMVDFLRKQHYGRPIPQR